MSREKRIALCLERIAEDLPNLHEIVDIQRVRGGEREELLVAAARIEAAIGRGSASSHAEVALLFLAANDYARARIHAGEAVAGRGDSEVTARGHALLGRLEEVADEPDAALSHYRMAVELHPTSWRHQLDLAAILIERDDPTGWEEASEALSAAAALAGESEPIALSRAQLMLRYGHVEDARRTLQALVREGSVRFAATAAAILATLS